jgi:NodT family efflux transporter outer membrane factor (OMF) lipoprotein
MNSRMPVRIAALATAALLGGCAVGPDFTPPAPPATRAYTPTPVDLPAAGAADVQQTLGANTAVVAQWWTLFQSPALNDTLDLAIADSPTLDAARAALAQAQETVTAAAGGLYPQVDLGAAASRSRVATGKSSGVANLFSIGPLVSYNPDLFGATRRFVEQQSALADFQQFQLAAAYLALTGDVVTEAINIAGAREQLAAADAIIQADRQNLELVRLSVESGKGAPPDLLAAESQLAADQALVPPLRQLLATSRDALATLVGKAPSEWQMPEFDFTKLQLPADLPLVVPSELVHARPDILAAEAQLHAASAAIGVATANLYPSISLSASWTQQSATLGALFEEPNGLWTVASSLTAPLFHGGTLEAEKRAAVDAFTAQLATYRQTVLTSFQQVADVLQALKHDAELVQAQRRALDSASSSLRLAQESYSAGSGSFLQVLDAQRLYQQARLGYAKAKGQRYLDTAELFAAMGGDWKSNGR